jgi:hypothetical protein
MADYTVGIGGGTTLMIRDLGGWVEFWMQTGSSTWNNDQQYSFSANGGYSGVRKFRLLRGGYWQYVDAVWVGYDQTITFTVYGSGIGFPTYAFHQHIQRSTVPQPPTFTGFDAISSSAFRAHFYPNSDGGSPILEFQIGYGSSSNGPTSIETAPGSPKDIGGFYSGQRIYAWIRARNALGWSGWSGRGEATTWQVPAAPNSPSYYNVTQRSVGVQFTFTKRYNDPPNLEMQFKYGRDGSGVVIDGTVNVNETVEYLYNLDPGKVYYFWGRARNSVGWGPWSPTASMLVLIAGARVLVAGQWKRAVPYVKTDGTWKVAEPWVKNAGVWKKTAQ